MKLKISYVILFVLVTAFCAFGQSSVRKSKSGKKPNGVTIAKRKPVKAKPDPCSSVVTETDRMTGETKRFTEHISVSNEDRTSLLITPTKYERSYGGSDSYFEILLLDNRHYPICVQRGSEVIILFEDGSRVRGLTFSPNCEGMSKLSLNASLIIKLRLTKVSTIRVYTSYGYIEADFDPDESEQMLQQINCIHR